jgi:cell wall-associated NlpC family hydrolase
MKNLFFVSVAVGIFSGTSISAKAQTSVNSAKFTVPSKKNIQFIEGIEIKREAVPAQDVDMWAVQVKKATISKTTNTPAKRETTYSDAAIENCQPLQFKYAQLLNTDVEAITNIKLYEAIEDWWATRYRYGGTTKNGVDCSALTGAILSQAFNITAERTARAQYAQSQKIERANLAEGDLVFFNTRGGVSHVGIYLGNGYFVHSSVHSGVTINSLDDTYYGKKYIGGGRIIQE